MHIWGPPRLTQAQPHQSGGGPMGAGGVRATHRYKFQYNHQAQLPPPPQPCLVPQGTKQQPRQGGGVVLHGCTEICTYGMPPPAWCGRTWVRLYIDLSIYLSMYLLVYLCIYFIGWRVIGLFIHPAIYLSVYFSAYLFVYLSGCVFIYLFIYVHSCPSICRIC